MGALPPVGLPALRLVSGRADQRLSDVVESKAVFVARGPSTKRAQKKLTLKHKPIANVRLRQIPDSHIAAPRKSAFAQSVNRTKMFHVKQFCPIGG